MKQLDPKAVWLFFLEGMIFMTLLIFVVIFSSSAGWVIYDHEEKMSAAREFARMNANPNGPVNPYGSATPEGLITPDDLATYESLLVSRHPHYNDTLTDISLEAFSVGLLKWIWIIIPLYLIWRFIWAKLTYHFYRYELTDAGFRKELGVIYKTYVTIPYDRIQNVDIYRGILDRILGLSSVNIQTAGASGTYGSEGVLPGLSREVAEQVRDELIQRARQSKSQGQGL